MSISLDPIVNTNTFGVWKDRTNEIVQALEDVVTIGGATDNRVGDITIRGDITSTANLVVDTINVYSPASDLALNGAVRVDDGLTINNGGDGTGQLTFTDDGSITWKIHTSSDHDHIDFIRNDKYMRIDYSEASITGSGLKIHADILPTTDSIEEGSNNLYYEDERVWASLSVATGSSITYDSTTGEFDFTMPEIPTYGVTSSKALKRTAVTGGFTFGVNFDNDTIKINSSNSLYVPDAAIRAAISSGTGVSIDDGQISIGQAVSTSSSVTFDGLTANNTTVGDLSCGDVSGSNASFSAISGSKLAGNWIATTSEATTGTNDDQVMTPAKTKAAILAWAEPIWAGLTTTANVKETYKNSPVGTRVAYWEERSYTRPANSNGGNVSITDRYYRVLRKARDSDNYWVSAGG